MKKTILLVLVCLFVVAGLSAARSRAYTQQVAELGSELPNLQFPDVVATSTQHQAGYVLNAWITTRPTEIISTTTQPASQIRLYRFGNGTTMPYSTRIFLNFQAWATDWTGGETIHIQLINNNVEPATQGSYEIVIPNNTTAAWTVADPVITFDVWPAVATEPEFVAADPAIVIAGSGMPEGVVIAPVYAAMVSFNSNTTMDITYPPLAEPELGPGIWTGWIYHSGAWHEADNAPLTGPGRLLFQDVVFTGGKSESPILYDNDVLVTPIAHGDCPIAHDTECPVDGNPEHKHYIAEGTGINDLMVPYDPIECHAFAWLEGAWVSGDLVIPNWVWEDVDFDAAGGAVYVVTYMPDGPPPLPVTFSGFSATLTAQNFVKLTWVTETETGVSGYRVLRSEANDVASAITVSSLISATNTSTTQVYNHIDNEVVSQTTYYYWLEVVDMDGATSFHGPTNVYVEANEPPTPSAFSTLENAYPNPFKANSNTNIVYQVKAGETGTITIYNIIGQVVKTVPVSQTNGQVTLKWNGRDSKGNVCASGIYFYKLNTPSLNITKKMVIVN